MLNKLTHLLICLALAITPAAAGWLPLTEPSTTPVSNACSTSSGTSITFTAQGVGGANPNRITVVSINWDDSTNAGTAQLTAMSVGGISMSRAASATIDAQNSNSEVWYATNPSGTTANIVATFATAVNGVTIEVYSLIGYASAPIASTTGTTSVSQLYNNKQVALAAASRTINVSTSLSNMTNDFSSACGANLWGVHASQVLRGNNQTLTSTISPTSNNPKIALAVWSTQSASDPFFSSVVLLTPFDGANGSTGSPGMDDVSSAKHGTAIIGSPAQISTAQFEFGLSSLIVNGSDNVSFPNSADWQLGSGSFTIEAFIRPANISSVGMIVTLWGDSGSFGWHLFQNNATLGWEVSTTGGNAFTDLTGGTLVANTWHAICVDFNGSKYRLYLNGTMVSSFSTPRTLFASVSPLFIGANASVVNPFPFNGFIDEIRITKGIARYASDGGYTVPVLPFPTN